MRSPKLPIMVFVLVALVPVAPQTLLAQYAINTVAGGGPNGLTAINTSVGNPVGIAFDAAGNLYIADFYSSHIFVANTGTAAITIASVVIQAGDVGIVAGNGTRGYSGDGGPATSAALNQPAGVFVDATGNIFIADTENSVIRKVSASTGDISTVAGNGVAGYNGDGISATSAELNEPYGVFVDGSGDIFIADTFNHAIREVVGGTIQTVAGDETFCVDPTTPCGDGGPATSAQLDLPEAVFVDASGNIFIADTFDSRVRVVNTGTTPITIGTVTIPATFIQTVAGAYYDSDEGTGCQYSGDGGSATAAALCMPSGVFVDSSENIFIADSFNNVIREVSATTGYITPVAGDNALGAGYSGNGGPATSAQLDNPSDVLVDASGDIFIADTDNSVIREVTASNSEITTVVGNNTQAWSGDGGSPLVAELNYPAGVFVDSAGNVFIADSANSVIREVLASTGDIQTVAGDALLGAGYNGDGIAATSAQLNSPEGVFVDSAGNIFIADTGNCLIRKVSGGTISTVAGNPALEQPCGYSGDTGLATSAQLDDPFGVFVDSAGNIFIADTDNSAIREVTASSGDITTVAGNGTACSPDTAACGDNGLATSAQLSSPQGVFVDTSENIYIADTSDNRIRVVANLSNPAITIAGVTISPGYIATVAGTGAGGFFMDGTTSISALLDTPSGVFVDLSGDIFIADTDNAAIEEVVAATGLIQTVAGIPAGIPLTPTPGFSGDGGQSTSAELHSPSGVFVSSTGNLFIADTDNQRIRELAPAIFVTVTPNPVNVAVSTQAQFTATVTCPGTCNTAVTWQVNGIVGGNSTIGTISTTGLFQAPTAVPTPAIVTITAISQADNTTSGSAQATIVPTGDAVTVTVTTNPSVSQVYTSTTQVFMATVTGTSDTAVTWQVDGVTGGNATVGTIDGSGNYTAPASVPNPATVTVEAVSQAVSSAVGSEQVLIVTTPSAAPLAGQTTTPGGTVTYPTATLTGGAPGQTITLSCSQSTLPPSAACKFVPSTIVPGNLQQDSFVLTITVPSGSASLQNPAGMRPQIYFAFVAFVPLAGILLGGIGWRNRGRNKRQGWLWLAGLCVVLVLLNACGGGGSGSTPTNPEVGTYNVKVQGTTSAQPNPVTITTAGLTVAQ